MGHDELSSYSTADSLLREDMIESETKDSQSGVAKVVRRYCETSYT